MGSPARSDGRMHAPPRRPTLGLVSEVSAPIRLRLCIEDILRERIPLLDGVHQLLALAEDVPALAGDRDLARLAQILSDHEHLPIGSSRAHWNAEALHRFDRELMEVERRFQAPVFYACRRLMEALA
jgi:hypothetical protein